MIESAVESQFADYSEPGYYLDAEAYTGDYHASRPHSGAFRGYSDSKTLPSGMDDRYAYPADLFNPAHAEGGPYNFPEFPYSNGAMYAGADNTGKSFLGATGTHPDILHTGESSASTLGDHANYMNYAASAGQLGANEAHLHPNDWMGPAQYDFDQFSEYIPHDESGERDGSLRSSGCSNDQSLSSQQILQHGPGMAHGHPHFLAPGQAAIHVNPAVLDGSFGMSEKSGVLINLAGLGAMGCTANSDMSMSLDDSPSGQRKAARQAGVPTNVIPTAKMDRKTLKRLRNRVSASRCRIKKKNWIKDMEEASESLADENQRLLDRARRLEQVIMHCQQLLNYGCKNTLEQTEDMQHNLISSSTLIQEDQEEEDGQLYKEEMTMVQEDHSKITASKKTTAMKKKNNQSNKVK